MLHSLEKKICLTLFILFWTNVFIFPIQLYALPSNKILKTAFKVTHQKEIILIQTLKKPLFKTFTDSNPDRIVLTIKDSFLPEVHHSENVFGKKIDRFRISQNTKNRTRIVVDLYSNADYQTKTTALNNGLYLLEINIPIVHDQSRITPGDKVIKPVVPAQSAPSRSIPLVQKKASLIPTPPIAQKASPDKASPDKASLKTDPPDNQTVVMMDDPNLEKDIFSENGEEVQGEKALILSGSIQIRPVLDLDHEMTNENKTGFKNRAILKADYKNITLSAISDFLYFGGKDETHDYDIDLHEAYLKHTAGNFSFSLGKQIIRWGKTDQISPVDTLNPENVTEFILPDYEERKIPVWMAGTSFRKNDFFIEGVFIPFFEPSKFNYFGTDWALFSHLKKEINDSPLSTALKNYFNSLSVNEVEPDHDSGSFEYALRVGGTVKQLDFGVTYHYSYEDLPYFQSFPIKNLSLENPNSLESLISNSGSLGLTDENIETRFKRTNIYGFEFETIIANFGLRGEAAFKDKESFLTGSFTSVRNPTLFWVAGIDYTSLNEWYFNLQFGHQHISNYDSSILFFKRDNYSILGEIKRDVFSDWLNVSLQYTVMLSDSSYYLSPRILYSYIRSLEIIFGINLFEGSENSIFGRYNKNDQLFLDLKYYF